MAKNKNHHLRKRRDIWYFEAMVKGKRIKRALSASVTEARDRRDALLRDIAIHGDIDREEIPIAIKVFGEVAQQWVKIMRKKVKTSTLTDYRNTMNYHILPRFGNVSMADITYLDVEEFISELECSHKRINNTLVPMRSLMKFALKAGLIEKTRWTW